jgi:hypothetical protein
LDDAGSKTHRLELRAEEAGSRRISTMNIPLTLTVTSERTSYSRGAPIQLTVTLRNMSTAGVWVNGRMGVGYEDSPVRELYFTVYTAEGQVLPVPDEARTDVHRMPPRKDDFRYLEPGQSIATVVDLSMWYPFTGAGRHRIVFTYENIWDGKQFGVDALTGRVSSESVSLVVE